MLSISTQNIHPTCIVYFKSKNKLDISYCEQVTSIFFIKLGFGMLWNLNLLLISKDFKDIFLLYSFVMESKFRLRFCCEGTTFWSINHRSLQDLLSHLHTIALSCSALSVIFSFCHFSSFSKIQHFKFSFWQGPHVCEFEDMYMKCRPRSSRRTYFYPLPVQRIITYVDLYAYFQG